MADTQNTNVQEQDIHQLLKVKREKLANLQQAGKDPFQITKYDVTHHSTDIKNNFEELEGKTVRLAGRMMSKRIMGKASFAHLRDDKGDIQLYVRRDELGEEAYAAFKKLDVGDIIGVKGDPDHPANFGRLCTKGRYHADGLPFLTDPAIIDLLFLDDHGDGELFHEYLHKCCGTSISQVCARVEFCR